MAEQLVQVVGGANPFIANINKLDPDQAQDGSFKVAIALENTSESRCALEWAASTWGADKSTVLQLVTVTPSTVDVPPAALVAPAVDNLSPGAALALAHYAQDLESLRAGCEEHAARVINDATFITCGTLKVPADRVTSHVLRPAGGVAESLVDFVRQERSDVLVMGSRGLAGFKRCAGGLQHVETVPVGQVGPDASRVCGKSWPIPLRDQVQEDVHGPHRRGLGVRPGVPQCSSPLRGSAPRRQAGRSRAPHRARGHDPGRSARVAIIFGSCRVGRGAHPAGRGSRDRRRRRGSGIERGAAAGAAGAAGAAAAETFRPCAPFSFGHVGPVDTCEAYRASQLAWTLGSYGCSMTLLIHTSHDQRRQVVVSLDESPSSQSALEWTLNHVVHNGDLVHLVSVARQRQVSDVIAEARLPFWPIEAASNERSDEAKGVVDHAALKAQAMGLPAADIVRSALLPQGRAWVSDASEVGDTVLQYAQQRDADLLVLGNRGAGALHRTLLGLVGLGSVSRHVMHHAKCPVLVVKSSSSSGGGGASLSGSSHGGPSPSAPLGGSPGSNSPGDSPCGPSGPQGSNLPWRPRGNSPGGPPGDLPSGPAGGYHGGSPSKA